MYAIRARRKVRTCFGGDGRTARRTAALTYRPVGARRDVRPAQLATEKDFLEAVNKVIKGYKKFSSTPRYMTYN